MENNFVCEKCGGVFNEFYEYRDDFNQTHICEDCFNETFQSELDNGNFDWFEGNFNNPVKEFPNLKFNNWR